MPVCLFCDRHVTRDHIQHSTLIPWAKLCTTCAAQIPDTTTTEGTTMAYWACPICKVEIHHANGAEVETFKKGHKCKGKPGSDS